MTFDALTLHAVRDELDRALLGGRVQQLFPITAVALGLEVYAQHRRQYLLMSIDPAQARAHLLSAPLRRAEYHLTPFLLLLRKYVRDGRIDGIEQPRLERLLRLRISSRQDDGSIRHVELVLEAMGRRSNLLLLDEDGTIMDAMKRLAPSRNPTRPLLPHLRYSLPPAQERHDPRAESTIAHLRDEALHDGARRPLSELLASRLAGCSPQLGREIVFRAAGSVDALASPATDWAAVRSAIASLYRPLEDGSWQPTLALRHGQSVAFAPYPLTHLTDVELRSCASMSEAIETHYADNGALSPVEHRSRDAAAAVEARQGPVFAASSRPRGIAPRALLDAVARRREQLVRKRASLQRSLAGSAAMEELRTAGEAILANAVTLPAGQDSLNWDGRDISLDPKLDALENAQRYFREYRKARDAASQVPPLLRQVESDLAYLEELAGFLVRETDPAQIRALQSELTEIGVGQADRRRPRQERQHAPRRSGAAHPAGVRRVSTSEGMEIILGTSAHGNQTATFKLAQPDDVWLHARGVAGAHVVICAHGAPVSPTVLEHAAQLAAAHSAASGADKAPVDWTLRRYVKKRPGGRPGQVTYSREQTLLAEPTP